MSVHANVIDTTDAATDEFIEEGGTLTEWLNLSSDEQSAFIGACVQSRINEGYWFKWSDGTVRDWNE